MPTSLQGTDCRRGRRGVATSLLGPRRSWCVLRSQWLPWRGRRRLALQLRRRGCGLALQLLLLPRPDAVPRLRRRRRLRACGCRAGHGRCHCVSHGGAGCKAHRRMSRSPVRAGELPKEVSAFCWGRLLLACRTGGDCGGSGRSCSAGCRWAGLRHLHHGALRHRRSRLDQRLLRIHIRPCHLLLRLHRLRRPRAVVVIVCSRHSCVGSGGGRGRRGGGGSRNSGGVARPGQLNVRWDAPG